MKILKWFDKRLLIIIACLAVIAILGDVAIRTTVTDSPYETSSVAAESATPALNSGATVEQQGVEIPCDELDRVTCLTAIGNAEADGALVLEVLSGGEVIRTSELPASQIANNGLSVFSFDPIPDSKGSEISLRLTAQGLETGNVSLFYGSAFDTGKVQISDSSGLKAALNGEALSGRLCFALQGVNYADSYLWYWPACVLLLLAVIAVYLEFRRERNEAERRYGLHKVHDFWDYRFLIKQLVSRDFKIKYKRSVLGVLWSFINPLMTMLVQYFVFSQIFKNTVNNYPVYLMAGGILFGYMTECVDLGMNSITGNRDLINKVHIPLEIFPISRVLSSLINLGVSLLPLVIMMLATGAPFTIALIFVPYVVCMLAIFCVGLSLLFSAAMVFFRDMQFLWSVFSMFWMYITPIFYTEDIIAAQFLTVYRMNPMYQFLKFFRTITLEGQVPDTGLFLGCALSALIACLLGAWAFNANKKKFVLYL